MYVEIAFGCLFAVNAAAFGVFWYDKRAAAREGWRISEAQLLTWSFFGGWFAAKIAQRLLRHKTRKQPFGMMLNRIPLMWAWCIFLFGAIGVMHNMDTQTSMADNQRETPNFFQGVNR